MFARTALRPHLTTWNPILHKRHCLRPRVFPAQFRSPHPSFRSFHQLRAPLRCSRPHKHSPRAFFILLASSLLGGLVLCAIQSNKAFPWHTIHADADALESESGSSDSQESMKESATPNEQNPPLPPPTYDHSFWQPSGAKTLEERLSAESQIYQVDLPCGISRYDVSVVPGGSNVNCYSSASFFELPSHYWVVFGIYDGHNGNKVSYYLSRNLRNAIVGALADLYSEHATLPNSHVDLGYGSDNADYWAGIVPGRPYPPPEEFDRAIKRGFSKIDQEVVVEAAEVALQAAARHRSNEPKQQNLLSYQDAAGLLARAYCGSSAMVAVYENDTRQLRLANLGDSRAVLGRRLINDEGEEVYEVHVLTQDMDIPWGFIDDPPKRGNEHAKLVHAFGDGPWKWSTELCQRLRDAFPFITTTEPRAEANAEPVVTNIEIRPGDFLVLANAGLWSSLTNEEAVGLVGLWLKKYRRTVFVQEEDADSTDSVTMYEPEISTVVQSPPRAPASSSKQLMLRKDVFERRDLPVDFSGKSDNTFMYRRWGIPKRFVNVDRNVAQHLVRNAIGGADKDLMGALVQMNSPRSNQHWNGVSVEVVFFT